MYEQIINRMLGGASRYTNRGHSIGWQTPTPTSDMYLERLETASSDHVNLMEYLQGLPIACQFGRAANSHLLAVTDEDGRVSIFDTESGKKQIPRVHSWQAHNNAVFDYLWVNNDSQCLTAAGDQTVALWDANTTTRVTIFVGHSCSVRSLAARPGSTVQFASGARDGHIMLWDTRVNKKQLQQHNSNLPAKDIRCAHSLATRANLRRHRRIHRAAGPKGVMDTQQSVTCVLYHTENVLISSGANDGCVKLWDTRKWYTNSSTSLPQALETFDYPGHMRRLKGIVTMCLDPWKSRLFASYTDNKVYCYELSGTYREPTEYVYAGHRNDTFFVRCAISPDGKYLLSGSGSNTGVIWEVDRPEKRPMFLIGHNEDVSAVDWCPRDFCKLATLSDDMSLRIWRPDCRQRNTEDPSIMGFTYTAGIGKQCQRQSQVHIVQDEFPFSQPIPSSDDQDSSVHTPPAARPRWAEPSMRQVFWAQFQTPRRSPRKVNKSSPGLSSSPVAGGGSLQQGVSSPSGAGGNRRKECGCTRDDGYDLAGGSPRPCDTSVESSPRPSGKKNGGASSSQLLPFSAYALRSSPRSLSGERSPRKCGASSKKGEDAGDGLCPTPCFRSPGSVGSRSPRVCRCRSLGHSPVPQSPRRKKTLHTPVKSPRNLLSPTKSPPRCGGGGQWSSTPGGSLKPRRQLFNSPTASLPNSVLDTPPPKPAPLPPTQPEKKVDWLTRFRLAKRETSGGPGSQDSNPGPSCSSTRLCGEGASASVGKDRVKDVGRRSYTPKRQAPGMEDDEEEGEEEEVTSGKGKRRKGGDRLPTPRNTRRSGSFSKPGTSCSSRTPRRKSSVVSPKTPTNMSIKRYLQ